MKGIIAALLVFSSTNLVAQAADTGGYLFGGLTVPWQQGATTDEFRIYLAAPGGWSAGWFLGGGTRVTRLLSVEAELRRSGMMEQIEPGRYSITYSARRRDTMIGIGARAHLSLSDQLAFEPLGLFEFVREESWLAQRQEVPGLPPVGDLTDHVPFVNSWGRALAGGADIRIGGGQVALLSGFRVHRFWRSQSEESSTTWPGGVSRWGVDITLGVRADF